MKAVIQFSLLLLLALAPFRQAAAAAAGGPDGFGYSWIDSVEAGFAYNFEDISGTGTTASTVSGEQDATGVLPSGFPFHCDRDSDTTRIPVPSWGHPTRMACQAPGETLLPATLNT
jgi:hypothetical protein